MRAINFQEPDLNFPFCPHGEGVWLNFGDFKGLIIADDVVHIHATIIGAIFVLTNGPSAGNVIGNGNGALLFYREAISNGVKQGGVSTGGGGVSVIGYYE